MQGRKPEPAGLKEAKGNPGKRKIPKAGAAASAGEITPSSKLGRPALSIWHELKPELERMNFIRPTDRHALSRYCDTMAEYWRVTLALRSKSQGLTYETTGPNGSMTRINPLFLIQDRLEKRLMMLEDRFGMNPMARQQIMLRLAERQPQLPLGPQGATEPAPDADAPGLLDNPIGVLSPTRH